MALSLPPAADELLERLGGRRRATIAGVGLLTVFMILGLSHWATRPVWVPVFSNIPLEMVGDVTLKLEEAGIPHRLAAGGADVTVATEDLARARVALAQDGLPTKGRPGLELFDQPSWGMTDFAQRINYRRALEGELERTVGKMRGVEAAKVHIAMRETTSFRDPARRSSASVVVKLRNGQSLPADVVQGVQHLVASSIDGMESGAVTVLDDSGRMLSLPDTPGSVSAVTSRQIALQREVEMYLERKAMDIVSQVVGANNVQVRVAAAINFDRVERTVQSVDPDAQVLSSEQKAEIIPGAEGGAGSQNTALVYENSRSVENFSGAIGNVKRLSVAVLLNQTAAGEPAGEAPAARTPEELRQIEMLVRGAVGVDEARGDAISVASLPFAVTPDMFQEPKPDVWAVLERFQKPAISLLALLLVVFVALRALRTLRVPEMRLPQSTPALAGAASSGGVLHLPDVHALNPAGSTELRPEALPIGGALPELQENPALPPVSGPVRTIHSQVRATVERYPEAAVRVMKAWMRDG